VHEDVALLPPTTREQAAALARMSAADAAKIVVRSGFADGDPSVTLIGKGASLDWPHGFTLTQFTMRATCKQAVGSQNRPTVLFVHRGAISIETADGPLAMGDGDTISLPSGFTPEITATYDAILFAVEAE
jgi:hypothetical protein